MSHIADLVRQDRFKADDRPARSSKQLKRRVFLAGAAALMLAGAGVTAWHASADTATSGPAAVAVAATTVRPQAVRLWAQFSGRLQAVDAADLRPQVNGRIVDVRFHDGQMVKAGDVLFVVDPAPYAAAVEKAKADLASAQTNLKLARTEFARAARLVKQQALARSIYDQRANARQVARANVSSAKAELQQAQIDLDHAYLKAPIDGRISRPEITLGNLVEAGANAPLLASIVSGNGIYADFNVDEQTYLSAMRAAGGAANRIAVRLTVPDAAGNRVYDGTIYSFDNKIDPATGTIRARARFDNRDGTLLPGMFVSISMASGFDPKALLAPDRAISSNQSESYVYVVGGNGTAEYRSVTLGPEVGGARVVRSGLHAGDRLIVDGIQHVTAGAAVHLTQVAAKEP